ncbi:hypothetical protein ACCI51_18020 [Microbulbifer echini]|uniref:PH domain-containing protein n=1 Tax=Microbulbifer echini TaxID=1529067 RepID=A0ABV4NTZ5_9GAMM
MELQSNKVTTYILGGFVFIWLLVSLSFALDNGSIFSWIATTLLSILAVMTFSFKKNHFIDIESKQYISRNQILWHNWIEKKPLSIFKGLKIVSSPHHVKDSKKTHVNWQVVLVFKYASSTEGINAGSFYRKEDAQRHINKLQKMTDLPLVN